MDKWRLFAARLGGSLPFSQRVLRHCAAKLGQQRRRLQSMPENSTAAAPATAAIGGRAAIAASTGHTAPAVVHPRKSFYFAAASFAIPHSHKRKKAAQSTAYAQFQSVGEDSYFLAEDAVGVADGVGGWADVPGADPALYALKLMRYSAEEIAKYQLDPLVEHDDGPTGAESAEGEQERLARESSELSRRCTEWLKVDPRQILFRAAGRVPRKLLGSSTATIAIVREDELRLANLGDSGARLYRHSSSLARRVSRAAQFRPSRARRANAEGDAQDAYNPFRPLSQAMTGSAMGWQCLLRTQEQTHSFNHPFQLGSHSQSNAQDADVYSFPLVEDDVLVLATDGVWDNLFDRDIRAILDEWDLHGRVLGTRGLAERIARRAFDVSVDRTAVCPFTRASDAAGFFYSGGKPDDITVVCCEVKPVGDSPDRR